MRKNIYVISLSALILFVMLSVCFNKANSEDRKISNLRTFAKLYGYVRYFHPSDEASKIDWEWFAIDGVSKVKDAKSSGELQDILKDLFCPIAPTIQIFKSNEQPKKIVIPQDTNLQIVTWQHYGIGTDEKSRNIYKSVRTNRQLDLSKNDFNCYRIINATEYQNKEVILKLKIQSEFKNSNSFCIFYASNYNFEKGKYENYIGLADTIISNGLKELEIELKVTDNATNLDVGITFSGQGKIIIDDFQLLIKKNDSLQQIEIPNSGFEVFNSQGNPVDWNIMGDFYNVSPNINNPLSGKVSLEINSENTIQGQIFNTIPRLDDVLDKNLDSGLKCSIPLALLSDEKGTIGDNPEYPFDSTKYVMRKINSKNEDSYSLVDENVRLADVIISWNIFQHFFPYFEYVSLDWEQSLTNTLEKSLINITFEDFTKTLEYMLEPLQDGHISVFFKGKYKKCTLPILADMIGGKVIVKKSLDTTFIKIGDIITKIDDKPIESLIAERIYRISGSKQWKQWMYFNYGLLGEGNAEDTVKLTIERNNSNKEVNIKRVNKSEISSLFDSDKKSIYEIEPKIYFINIGTTTQQEIINHLSQFQTANGIIIDLREYPKDNNFVIFQYLTDKNINSPGWYVPQIIYPNREKIQFDFSNWQVTPEKPFLKSKKVFIIDNGTISAGETFSSIIKSNKLGILVGQYTAGANGNVNFFRLPGNISIYFSGMKVVNEDGSRFYIKGVEPDIFVNKTIKAVKEERDEFLEKAIGIIKR